MSASVPVRTAIDQPRAWAWAWVLAAAVAASIAVLAALAAARVIGDLESMQADVHRMSDRLGVLDSVNEKLGKLETVSSEVGSMQREVDLALAGLRRANGLLATANGQLGTANGALARASSDVEVANGSMKSLIATTRGMNRQLKAVGSMSADIHEMAHKLDGSFLFRGVK